MTSRRRIFSFCSPPALRSSILRGRSRRCRFRQLPVLFTKFGPSPQASVHIKSTKPSDLPEIRANYLSSDIDRTTMVRGLRLVAQIFEQKPMAPYLTNRLSPHDKFDLDDDVALLKYIRANAGSAYHPTSTCAIGKVVDPKLSVYGIEALSVADASVMPQHCFRKHPRSMRHDWRESLRSSPR